MTDWMESTESRPWWADAVIYQIYPRSFADGSGDGVGDLRGIIDRLGYLELLGVDAVWLSPVMTSPQADHGYDVSDPRDIDPLFGTLDDFAELVTEAHATGLKVIMDLVPNHTSIERRWFKEALAAGPGSPERDRYWFRDGRGANGEEPPNNWRSVFGGPAWTRITEPDGTPGQWYLHLFAPEQADLHWSNADVRADLEKTLRFWLDLGVDGFRVDVAHGLAKPEDLPDMPEVEEDPMASSLVDSDHDPRFDNEGVHEILRELRAILDSYDGDRFAVGEVWVSGDRFAPYVAEDELSTAFNFSLAEANYSVSEVRAAIDGALSSFHAAGASPSWTLSNHDIVRPVTRYSVEGDDSIDGEQRARAMLLIELALPGATYLYNGEELALPEVTDLPKDVLQDPIVERSGGERPGRDGCRVPLPWEGSTPPYGFSTSSKTWLPQPDLWSYITAEAQLEDVYSMLSLVRAALEVRRHRPEFRVGSEIEWYGAPQGCLAFRRKGTQLVCAVNMSRAEVPPPAGQLLLTSTRLRGGLMPPDSAVWIIADPLTPEQQRLVHDAR